MLVALVIIATVALIVVAALSAWGGYLARKAADETRAQMHSALVDERSGWLAQQAAWNEERQMLLDRLSDREGRQISVLQPATQAASEPTKLAPVTWDADLEPFDFEARMRQEDGDEAA